MAAAVSGSLLADHLVRSGKLKRTDLETTQQLASERPQSLGLLLTRVGLASDRDVAGAYAQILNKPLLAEGEIPAAPIPGIEIKEAFLRDAKILPLEASAEIVRAATADPENSFALQAFSMAVRRPVVYSIGTLSQVDRALDQWFGAAAKADATVVEGERDAAAEGLEAVDRLRDLASEAPVVRFVNTLIQRAVDSRASDIHVEPKDGHLRIRYRVDGVLLPIDLALPKSAAAVVSRIKLMARMNIAERRLPQDGRVQLRVHGSAIDLRVATVPTIDGESVVLRILDQERVSLELATLGFDDHAVEAIRELIAMPHGILLVTGPTGSGKTTTLYAALQSLNAVERKILTIEDPVEYQIAGINQIQVKPQIGLDFPQALRAIVRQDPDVIMVGEMRDLETARIAVQSALTGHLVFSTLHTNDAGSSITRLLDMGVEDYLVTSSVNGIIAQRLVRRLCPVCRESYEPLESLSERLNLRSLAPTEPMRLFRPVGCSACDGTGYRGRSVIFEVMAMTDALRRSVLSRADGKSIEGVAVQEGMETMYTCGLRKALRGVTTIEEVTRVAHLP